MGTDGVRSGDIGQYYLSERGAIKEIARRQWEEYYRQKRALPIYQCAYCGRRDRIEIGNCVGCGAPVTIKTFAVPYSDICGYAVMHQYNHRC